jgi:hypothetical protein
MRQARSCFPAGAEKGPCRCLVSNFSRGDYNIAHCGRFRQNAETRFDRGDHRIAQAASVHTHGRIAPKIYATRAMTARGRAPGCRKARSVSSAQFRAAAVIARRRTAGPLPQSAGGCHGPKVCEGVIGWNPRRESIVGRPEDGTNSEIHNVISPSVYSSG